jgi:hypothetical protein
MAVAVSGNGRRFDLAHSYASLRWRIAAISTIDCAMTVLGSFSNSFEAERLIVT